MVLTFESIRSSLERIWWIVLAGLLLMIAVSTVLWPSYEILVRAPFFILAICVFYEALERIHLPRETLYRKMVALVATLLITYMIPIVVLLVLLVGSVVLAYILTTRRSRPYSSATHCPRCGSGIHDMTGYCPNCGYDIRAPRSYPPVPQRQPSSLPRPSDYGEPRSITPPPVQGEICPACNRNRLRSGQGVCDECGRKLLNR